MFRTSNYKYIIIIILCSHAATTVCCRTTEDDRYVNIMSRYLVHTNIIMKLNNVFLIGKHLISMEWDIFHILSLKITNEPSQVHMHLHYRIS